MDNNIVTQYLIDTKGMGRDEWLNLRKHSMGGSTMGTVMGMDDYKSPARLYEEYVGLMPEDEVRNEAVIMGRYMEAFVADLWQYWNPSAKAEEKTKVLLDNIESKNIVRKCETVDKMLIHPEYPFISANIDRLILPNEFETYNGILEIKTMNGRTEEQWDIGFPPKYLIQLQLYIWLYDSIFGNCNYGEIAILVDGRSLRVYRFEKDAEIIEAIKEYGIDFWNRVEKGREAVEKGDHESAYSFEPAPTGTPAHEAFLSQKYKEKSNGQFKEGKYEDYQELIKLDGITKDIKDSKIRQGLLLTL